MNSHWGSYTVSTDKTAGIEVGSRSLVTPPRCWWFGCSWTSWVPVGRCVCARGKLAKHPPCQRSWVAGGSCSVGSTLHLPGGNRGPDDAMTDSLRACALSLHERAKKSRWTCNVAHLPGPAWNYAPNSCTKTLPLFSWKGKTTIAGWCLWRRCLLFLFPWGEEQVS